MIPIITLKNGLRIGNFSSPHPFTFTTGEVLPACSDERAKALMLKVEERETQHQGWTEGYENKPGWTDIKITFSISEEVLEELGKLTTAWRDDKFDILLVPFPVLTAVKQANSWATNCVASDALIFIRTIRSADRVTKVIHPDRFCK